MSKSREHENNLATGVPQATTILVQPPYSLCSPAIHVIKHVYNNQDLLFIIINYIYIREYLRNFLFRDIYL